MVKAWLSELTTGELGRFLARMDVALLDHMYVYPDDWDTWSEIGDLCDDGHASWKVAFNRERVYARKEVKRTTT